MVNAECESRTTLGKVLERKHSRLNTALILWKFRGKVRGGRERGLQQMGHLKVIGESPEGR